MCWFFKVLHKMWLSPGGGKLCQCRVIFSRGWYGGTDGNRRHCSISNCSNYGGFLGFSIYLTMYNNSKAAPIIFHPKMLANIQINNCLLMFSFGPQFAIIMKTMMLIGWYPAFPCNFGAMALILAHNITQKLLSSTLSRMEVDCTRITPGEE